MKSNQRQSSPGTKHLVGADETQQLANMSPESSSVDVELNEDQLEAVSGGVVGYADVELSVFKKRPQPINLIDEPISIQPIDPATNYM